MTGANPRAGDPIALYGSLMRGLGPLEELGFDSRLRFVGPCVVQGELFDLGPYPALRPGKGRVLAELHRLSDPGLLLELDAFEGYDPEHPERSLYLRERVTLIEPSGIEAWCYLYRATPDRRSKVASGDWRAHLEKRAECIHRRDERE